MRYLTECLLMALVVSVVVFAGLFAIQTNRLVAVLEDVTVSYSSHNDITARTVTIHDGAFDVAAGPAGFEVE
jgi:hypothetical protein